MTQSTIRTTYFGGIGSELTPGEDDEVVGVVRRPQDFVHGLVDRNVRELGPPEDLLDSYKGVEGAYEASGHSNPSRKAWQQLRLGNKYFKHLNTQAAEICVQALRDRLDDLDGDLILVCWERDPRYCHRRLLADVLAERSPATVEHHPSPAEIAAEEADTDAETADGTDEGEPQAALDRYVAGSGGAR